MIVSINWHGHAMKAGEVIDWMYIGGKRKWYYNWVILIVSLGVCKLLFCYAIYKIWTDKTFEGCGTRFAWCCYVKGTRLNHG